MGGRGASSGGGGGGGGGKGSLTIAHVTSGKNFPKLTGTEKQVNWANSIRDKFFRGQSTVLAKEQGKRTPQQFQALLQQFHQHYSQSQFTQASNWINARDQIGRQ